MSKPSDNINNACITRLGYKFDGHQWVEQGRAPAVIEVNIDEEVEMDIPSPSPTTLASPYSPPPAPSATAGASSAPLDWYHDLSQRIDMHNLDLRALSEEHDR